MSADDWREHARCKGWDPELFYVERGQEFSDEVKAVCATCPVRIECLDFAVANKELGWWGGTPERARRKLRREQAHDGRVFDRRMRVRGRVWSEAS